jgi:hypothetical protein
VAIAFRAAGTVGTIGGGKPAGIANDDVLVCAIGNSGFTLDGSSLSAGTGLGPPTGWVGMLTSNRDIALFYKVITNAAGEPSSYSWTNNTGTPLSNVRGIVLAFTGVDTTTPSDATPTTGSWSNSTTVNAPSITTVTANTWLVGVAACSGSTGPTYTSSVWTEVMDDTGNNCGYLGPVVATGATGTQLWTGSAKAAGTTATAALRPVVAAAADIPDLNMAPYIAA